ncbi:MAG: GxxExxY protein [Candidatus Desantisbacteria bacterium]
MNTDYKYSDITEKIIGAAYKVYNTLGTGFLEKVYENALIVELKKSGLEIRQQEPIKVFYEKEVVGDYIADIVVNGKVIVEIKAVGDLNEIHEVQLINYLKATGMEIGLLINFGKKIEIKRKIFDQ